MRTKGRERNVFRVLLRSRWVVGLCLLALLAGLSQIGIGEQSAGAFIGQLVISPADARKAPRRPRREGADVRRPHGMLPFPFVPLPNGFAPLPPPQMVGPRGFRAREEARKPPGFVAPSRPKRQEATSEKVGRHFRRHRVEALKPVAHGRVLDGGWHTLIRHTGAEPGKEPPVPRPLRAYLEPIPKARAPFQHFVEKLHPRSKYLSQRTKTTEAPVDSKPRQSPSEGAGKSAGKTKPAGRRLGGRLIGEVLPSVGSFRPSEVLAINLSPEGRAKVRDGGYELVEHIELSELGMTLTRLRPPQGLNAVTGREQLFDLFPENGFALNRVYATYRPGSGGQGAGVGGEAKTGHGCPTERCFGGTLIKWQPSLATCARDIKVGIIDTGFDKSHPAFAGLRHEYKEFLPEGGARASSQHGTGVLSLLAGNADSGTPGLIPEASFVIANAFFTGAGGEPTSDTALMLQALHWLKKSGVAVVNLSFAGPEDDLLHHAVQELTKAGIVVVAAAGNGGPFAPPSYPAAYEEVIAVTAVDRNLAAYRYAGRGPHIAISAPGVDVWTAMPGGREGPQTGTSFAVPYVTAVVAVTLPGTGLAPDGDALSAKQRVLARLHGNIKSLGGQGRDPTFGAGLIQAPPVCAPDPVVTVASHVAPPTQPWASTVRKAPDPGPPEPLVVGSWVSTVHAASSDGVPR